MADNKEKRGFGSMPQDKVEDIARRGGESSGGSSGGNQGNQGGQGNQSREHMSKMGKKGGQQSGGGNR